MWNQSLKPSNTEIAIALSTVFGTFKLGSNIIINSYAINRIIGLFADFGKKFSSFLLYGLVVL
jgi:hypothetical protein